MTHADQLDRVIAAYLHELETGRSPVPADWIERHPEHAAELAEFFNNLDRFGSFLGLDEHVDPDATVAHGVATEAPGDTNRFGEYELLGEVGRGAMGVVFKARQVGANLVVALKQLPVGRLAGADAVARFRHEVENASGLSHPHIVPIYHVGEQDGRPFYTMALIQGGSLDGRIDKYRADPRATAMLVAKVARAVHHAHQRRLLHRDLKPGNILIDDAGEPHVADFGLSMRLDATGAAAGGPMAGSVPWMAPETIRGAALTTAVDVWALGVILYELLTGNRPFGGTERSQVCQAIASTDPPSPRTVNPRLSRDLDAICMRALAKDPDNRYESASALALDLERWLADEPVRARRTGPVERLVKWSRRHPAAAGVASFLAVLVVAGVAAAFRMANDQEARLRNEVCRGNEFAARHVASTLLGRLREFGDSIEAVADDELLLRACEQSDWPEVERLLRTRLNQPFATAFVVDPDGVIVAEWPQRQKVVGINVSDRDYVHGAVARAHRTASERVYYSRVFTSKNDGLDKLAVSIGFRSKVGGRVWVLGATIPTDANLGLGGLHDERRKAVLLAPRDAGPDTAPSEYVVLVHPGYAPREPSVAMPMRADLAADDDYADPVATHHPEYAGRWLAGFAPVPDTELVVLVQQPYREAVAPYRAFFRRFLEWLAGAAVGAAIFVAILWWLRVRRQSPN
jgi:eukaryotic-like serine/threonine-protein kinase